ncbi:putative cullin-like protein 2 isoform X1 [Lathyrus oleraceus]|uniref:putative cullin-like protein 2 isoform X1 n=1 Tax=Pisum sativum TaxID=3888 RepID=UPI001FC64058|nr:putative cullin-like protein 2 isoform X1 [Pisum sativum]
MRNQKFISFEEGWETLLKGITKLHRFLEGLEPTFTLDEHIKLYSTVYELCIQEYIIPRDYARELYVKYRETCEEYIVSKVLPSLREKKDDILLRELLRRWSNYKVMTRRLSYIFEYLDQYIRRHGLTSLEEINFSSFNHGIDQKLAGEKIDHTFVINTLDFYIKFYKCTKKDKAELCQQDLSKKINLRSSDGTVFEIDYGVALMSKRFEDITETISVGDKVDDFSVHKVSSKILIMVVEYCKKRRSYYEQMNRDDRFVKVDPKTLLDLTACACYMKIESLEKLTWSKVYGLIKGKTPEEIAQIFGDVDDSNSKLLEENIQRIESLEM